MNPESYRMVDFLNQAVTRGTHVLHHTPEWLRLRPGLFHSVSFIFLSVLLTVSCDTQPTASDQNGTGNGNGDDDPAYSHTRNPGMSAIDFLRNDDFTEVLVEIQYMPGYRPADSGLDELQAFLQDHLDKADVIIAEPEEVPSGGQEQYSANDVRQLEEEHRRHFTEGSTLASYNLFVDGSYTDGNVLGIAYYNTSNAYFGATIHDISGSPPLNPSREKVEGTVLRHEYGHLLGLVDNGVEMQEHHQENGPHCTDEGCVMYHAVNTTDFFANMFDDSISDLDEYCLQDIHAVQE